MTGRLLASSERFLYLMRGAWNLVLPPFFYVVVDFFLVYLTDCLIKFLKNYYIFYYDLFYY
jgi:hypothetical protein